MGSLWESLLAWLKERTASPLYGTYIITTIIWNWKFFYVLFFQDQSSLSVPKIDYVTAKFLPDSNFWHIVGHIAYFWIPPIVITYLIIWWMPIITNLAYKVSADYHFQRKLAFDKANLEYERRQKDILGQLVTVKEAKVATEKKIERATTERERWESEYQLFKKNNIFFRFGDVLNTIYRFQGYLGQYKLSPDILAVVDSRGLITLDNDRNQIELTEKGKYFAQRFFDDGFQIALG